MAAHEDGRVAGPQDHFPLHALFHAHRVYHRGYVLLSHIVMFRVSHFYLLSAVAFFDTQWTQAVRSRCLLETIPILMMVHIAMLTLLPVRTYLHCDLGLCLLR